MSQEKKKPVFVRCKDCKHEWAAFYTPLTLDKDGFALLHSLKKIRCPMCTSKHVFLGKAEKVA
jgi:ribosomal protein S27E